MCHGGPVSWKLKQQHSVADSTCEAEFRAIAKCGRHGEWLRYVSDNFGSPCTHPTLLCEDNAAAKKWTELPAGFEKKKHLRHDVFQIRESVAEFRLFDVALVPTNQQLADILTKALTPVLHWASVAKLYNLNATNIPCFGSDQRASALAASVHLINKLWQGSSTT